MMAPSSYGIINSFFNDDRKNNSNNNVSSSSCSTPTTSYPPQPSSATYVQTKTNKRDPKLSYENKNNPSSSSQPATPKKSNLSGTEESDAGAEKCINKISNRTKLFLTSFLKFKRSLRVKRRSSNSCSDLFVIWSLWFSFGKAWVSIASIVWYNLFDKFDSYGGKKEIATMYFLIMWWENKYNGKYLHIFTVKLKIKFM